MIVPSMTHAEVYAELDKDRDNVARWFDHQSDTYRRKALKTQKFPAQGAFKRATANARKAFQKQMTGNAESNRKLWISLTHQYNEKAARRLGWSYSATKNE